MAIEGFSYLKTWLQMLAYSSYGHVAEAVAEATMSCTVVLKRATRLNGNPGANIILIYESKPASPFGCMGSALKAKDLNFFSFEIERVEVSCVQSHSI